MKDLKNCDYRAISEVALNVLYGKIPLNKNQKKKLAKHKEKLRALTEKKLSLRQRKHIINQKGGFISALLFPAITTLIEKLMQ